MIIGLDSRSVIPVPVERAVVVLAAIVFLRRSPGD
jgi:hypothetical protein